MPALQAEERLWHRTFKLQIMGAGLRQLRQHTIVAVQQVKRLDFCRHYRTSAESRLACLESKIEEILEFLFKNHYLSIVEKPKNNSSTGFESVTFAV